MADQPCRCNLCRVLLEAAREAEANHQAARANAKLRLVEPDRQAKGRRAA